MIVGLGMDIVEIARIRHTLERFGLHFINRILHRSEADTNPHSKYDILSERNIARIAARFAAKEAGAKALGTGFTGGILFQDIRILSLASGKPEIIFHGKALEHANTLGVTHAHVSLTHARDTAGAVVVLESL